MLVLLLFHPLRQAAQLLLGVPDLPLGCLALLVIEVHGFGARHCPMDPV